MGGGKIDVAEDFRDLLRAFADHDVRFLIGRRQHNAAPGRGRIPRRTGLPRDSRGHRPSRFESFAHCSAS